MADTVPRCFACGGAGLAHAFAGREMMFGRREAFVYLECPHCGSLQIERMPDNLAEYYPPDYYSLTAPRADASAPWHKRAWARWLLGSRSGFAAAAARKASRKAPFLGWARAAEVGLESAILDVGCGSGALLFRMRRYGFTNLAGVDPYVGEERMESGVRIVRAELGAMSGRYDLVMFNHVLEHVADPAATLRAAAGLLAPGGKILVRVPVAGSFTHREYKEHWFNLDPPRHLAIPSVRGMTALAKRSGLKLLQTDFDSTEASLLMSENYRRDIPMQGAPAPTAAEAKAARRRIEELNQAGDGDCGVFLLAPDTTVRRIEE